MFPEAVPALNNSGGIMSAVNASMIVHPVMWTVGFVAVVGVIGYFAFFREIKLATVAS